MEELDLLEQSGMNKNIVDIKVIGVGGGGGNAVAHMIRSKMRGVEFYAANTDAQSLMNFDQSTRLHLGKNTTGGFGAGADPEIGKKAALESQAEIKNALAGAKMVFIASGMGGGTGTGAAPVVAKIAKDLGALTVAIVTTPFGFEGAKRRAFASEGLQELRPNVDSLIVVSNETLLHMYGDISMKQAFLKADDVLCQSVRAITSLITERALINLDFADVKTIMKDKGSAMIGMGKGVGEFKAREAASQAISSPLLGSTIKGAKNAIVNITCGSTMTLQDANEAVEIVREAAGDNINIIFGVTYGENDNESLQPIDDDYMCVTVIATEFSNAGLGKVPFERANETQFDLRQMESIIIPSKVDQKQKTYQENDDSLSPSLENAIPSFLKRK